MKGPTAVPRYLFVTGKLAEPALREVLAALASQVGFEYDVAVLNISVAALMTPEWVARRLVVPEGIERVYVPGVCGGDWSILEKAIGVPVVPGPNDVRDIPDHFGKLGRQDFGQYDISILAEINHAPRLSLAALMHEAQRFRSEGADVIDLGCEPGFVWGRLVDAVKALRDLDFRVSIDTFSTDEAEAGARAGAELVLSVNGSNREACRDWGCEVVAIPDQPNDLASLDATIEYLSKQNIPHRIDPILEPIGFGFAASLERYMVTRRNYPQHEMLMGIGNLSELTEADSAAVNLMLLSICQELGIRSVLTTAVANWAMHSVQECDLGRRISHYAIQQKTLPKKLDDRLLIARDRKLHPLGPALLLQLAEDIKDPNYRIFAEGTQLHIINGNMHLQGTDPFVLFDEMCRRDPKIDTAHAFYLGYEMAKAVTALTLRKNYHQDQALNWGYLTIPEKSHRHIKESQSGDQRASG